MVLVALAWGFLALPARRRQRSHQGMQDAVELGDEIITAGGIHALVREASDEQLRVEIAPGVVVSLDRRAVAAVAVDEPPVPAEPPAPVEPAAREDSGGEAS